MHMRVLPSELTPLEPPRDSSPVWVDRSMPCADVADGGVATVRTIAAEDFLALDTGSVTRFARIR